MDLAFRCLTGVGLRNVILGKMAFKQPDKQNYEFYADNGKLRMMTLSDSKNDDSVKVPAENFFQDKPHIQLDVFELNKGVEGEHVNLIYLKNQENPNNMTIMYCHGNSSCLGRLYPHMVNICLFG